jgi:hypothetical protein
MRAPTRGRKGWGLCPLRSVDCSAKGVEARPVDVQVQIAAGTVAFTIVGLGYKAVAESRERVRSPHRLGPRASGQAHHRQPRAGRHAERGQPLRRCQTGYFCL